MAIELVPQLTTGAPSAGSADWDKMIGLVSANEVPDLSFLTGWELTAGIPAIKQGVYIYHAGATYRVNNSDETISGTPATGLNYIEATVSAGVMTLAWVTSKTGYLYNAAYGGIYNAGDANQLLPDVLYITGSNYLRGRCFGMGFNFIHLSDGNFIMASGIDTLGADITTSGGNIDTGGGDIDTTNLAILGNIIPAVNTFGTETITFATRTWTVPEGLYMFYIYGSGSSWSGAVEFDTGGGSYQILASIDSNDDSSARDCFIASNGVDVRVNNNNANGTIYVRWVRV